MKLWRAKSFWSEPWFLTLAVIAGQLYGVWWMSLGTPNAPAYVPQSIVAQAEDPFTFTITAPALAPVDSLQAATN